MRPYNNRKDLNHREVILQLNKLGIWHHDVDACLGVDLLCGWCGVLFTLEIKSKRGKETARQVRHRERFKALALPHIVYREGEDLVLSLADIQRKGIDDSV